ncbi:MFS transporter [Desulfopila aestuarii]|uniref:Predicted arabinose efflux permease, MFS family n=1 Tax=Desulfopila aestuarii DSM 18488 TaxID=1121416 RepID=A0A1M7Y4S8_9BACT|nr:MFS transporter [Desulfopila aestuarii]SHO47282.1 Predicted arabinose efflux permease, MFS family [Desulfopila aestuarii DSM 18488]
MTVTKIHQPGLPESGKEGFRTLPKGVWVLGFVSMLMDISSELIHSLLPIFMVTTLGASVSALGFIEGIAEATAAITKIFSGAISDYFGRRKMLAVAGYTLGAMSKPLFPLATTIGWVFIARFIDRIGKGIRGAPRDALVADISPPRLWGAAYGLRQALDSVGAFVGPLLALVLMIVLAGNIHAVMWVAVVPGFLAVVLLMTMVHETGSAGVAADQRKPLVLADAKRLPLRFWLVVIFGAVFALARFSEAFLILRGQDVGLAIGYVPAIMIVMNVVYSVCAYPAGAAADELKPRTLLLMGIGVLIVADMVLAMAASPWLVFIGAAIWGLHMALTQGLFAKLVAETAPLELRGTAFGFFHLVSGGAILLASGIAGTLWQSFGASATFLAGATFAAVAALGLLVIYRKP